MRMSSSKVTTMSTRWVWLLVLLLSHPTIALADSKALQNQVVLSLGLATPAMSADQRKAFAEKALDYWRDIERRIPTNSPAESEWLQAELDTADEVRLARALGSAEWARLKLTNWADDCVSIFQNLVNAVGADKGLEFYLWLKATTCYANVESTSYYLKRAGLTSGNGNEEFAVDLYTVVFQTITGKLANALFAE